LSHFCLFSEIFCLFLQFFSLESCCIWFTISLEYPSAYLYSCSPGKIQNQGLSGGIRGCKNPILSHFCLFSEILCLFLQFSTLESCYIWFKISLEYLSAHVYSCSPGKIQNQGLSGGSRGCENPILSHFCLFSEILCLFLQFSTLESCYIWFTLSLEYPSAYVYSGCPAKFKIGVGQGYVNPILSHFCLFLRFSVFFLSFPHWNRVIFGLYLV